MTTVEEWHKTLRNLARNVKQWFREANTELLPPTDHGCLIFADCLDRFRFHKDEQFKDHRKNAIKYGGLFLKHISTEQEILQTLVRLRRAFPDPDSSVSESNEMLFRIEELQRHFKALLPYLIANRAPRDTATRHAAIRELAELAKELWAETNEGKAPRSLSPEGPLCQLLLRALEAINRALPAATLSEILRHRQRKRKADGETRLRDFPI